MSLSASLQNAMTEAVGSMFLLSGKERKFMWCLKMNETLQRRSDEVWRKTEEWRKTGGFKHRKPCEEWLNGERCSHYAKARYKHFKTEIDSIFNL
jgi:hypothetical protein